MRVTVSCHRLAVSFGATRVLGPLDLEVPGGSWLGVIGPNGAGKTTLLRAIAGLVPAHGTVRLEGDELSRLSRRGAARLVALVPQQPVIPRGIRIFDYVLLGRTPHLGYLARESTRDLEIVDTVLAELQLSRFAGRSVTDISGGEMQRVVIARALVQQSPVLLLDEPTTALDVGKRQEVLALVDRLRIERGLTVISALHDLTLAGQYADALILLGGGNIVATGSAARVLTPEMIQRHYGASVRVLEDPDGGIIVIPQRRLEEARPLGPERHAE
jgi:iron complex transport system ATP-binding protein